MKLKSLILISILTGYSFASALEAPTDAQAESNKLLAAISSGDYAAFVADGDTAFKGIKKEQFDMVAAQIGPRLKAGYEASYLGELNQRGYKVTLWRLRFSTGGDDYLATLSLKDGKIGGYWIK